MTAASEGSRILPERDDSIACAADGISYTPNADITRKDQKKALPQRAMNDLEGIVRSDLAFARIVTTYTSIEVFSFSRRDFAQQRQNFAEEIDWTGGSL